MVWEIIFKKRFRNKLEKLLIYLENDFCYLIAQRFARQLDKKFTVLQQQPLIGRRSVSFKEIRSIPAGKHNRIYYRIENNKIIVLNLYDTRIKPNKNRLK